MKKAALLLLTLIIITGCKRGDQTDRSVFPNDPYRPQVHFTPKEAWMNDPNGMVYYEGEYHLFYQYYPDSTVWGPMHWGHAISTDLVHWEHLPIALYPDSLGYIFSGSAVIDWNNTTGLQEGEHPPMVAIFTHHEPNGASEEGNDTFQYQSIAYSLDKGRSWTKYEGNPVVPNPGIRDFRDPKVSWHEATQQWVMIFAAADRVRIYNSPNLIDWEFQSEFGADVGAKGGVWECPDLFPLKEELTGETKWVMLVSINPGGPNGGSATQYFVGDFDGKTFSTEQEKTLWIDYGRDNYAGVTWSDIPQEDGRRLFMGWMSNWDYAQVVPTEQWRSAMTTPRSLHLRKEDATYLLASKPVFEMKSLIADSTDGGDGDVKPGVYHSLTTAYNSQGRKVEISSPMMTEVTFDLVNSRGKMFGIELSNNEGEKYYLVIKDGIMLSDRQTSGRTDFSEKFASALHTGPISGFDKLDKLKVQMIVDHASVEIFINDGLAVMTELVFPASPYNEALIFARDEEVWFEDTKTYQLQSIW
ncbi:glycoside hydrolase family 32 protein [Roseivirga sp.]|uniref:glycoside hydrolase family 32 protein n=1 Tax=Roseivirga sp. TaxID=1964215 RepID=UPI003B52575D